MLCACNDKKSTITTIMSTTALWMYKVNVYAVVMTCCCHALSLAPWAFPSRAHDHPSCRLVRGCCRRSHCLDQVRHHMTASDSCRAHHEACPCHAHAADHAHRHAPDHRRRRAHVGARSVGACRSCCCRCCCCSRCDCARTRRTRHCSASRTMTTSHLGSCLDCDLN